MTMLMGADGCKDGWIAAVEKEQEQPPRCERFTSIGALMEQTPAVIAIDVPIGLLERGTRSCDAEAKRLLGARQSSVFPAPIRPTLKATSHSEASALRFGVEAKKMSLQVWGIMSKVIQIDEALRDAPAWRPHIHEVHPEVCFYFLNGNRPMVHSKKRSEGRSERLELLCQQFGECVNDALASRRSLGCAADDIIDAFVCLWTARRIANSAAVQIPVIPLTDSLGLPMKMLA